jgi:hypothetical protein
MLVVVAALLVLVEVVAVVEVVVVLVVGGGGACACAGAGVLVVLVLVVLVTLVVLGWFARVCAKKQAQVLPISPHPVRTAGLFYGLRPMAHMLLLRQPL